MKSPLAQPMHPQPPVWAYINAMKYNATTIIVAVTKLHLLVGDLWVRKMTEVLPLVCGKQRKAAERT